MLATILIPLFLGLGLFVAFVNPRTDNGRVLQSVCVALLLLPSGVSSWIVSAKSWTGWCPDILADVPVPLASIATLFALVVCVGKLCAELTEYTSEEAEEDGG